MESLTQRPDSRQEPPPEEGPQPRAFDRRKFEDIVRLAEAVAWDGWSQLIAHEPMLAALRFEARRLKSTHPDEYRLRYERLKHLARPLVGHSAWSDDLQSEAAWDVALRLLCKEADV